MKRIHVIAEAGTNHGGCFARAVELAEVAKQAQADSVKFQIIYPEGLYVEKLIRDGRLEENPVISARRAGMLSDDDYRRLADRCREMGIPMSASVFDDRGISLLDEFNPPYFKIASCDLNNYGLLHRAASRGRKMIVSTGMATLDEIEHAVDAVTSTGNHDLVLMHCVSVYPCPTERMNLSFIKTLQTSFGFPVGLSDHTEQSLAAAAAVALGVTWIEKHFTLDRSSEGFDHAYAMEPDGLTDFIRDVREVERAMNVPPVKVGDAEAGVRVRARRGLYAKRDIAAGETITEDDVLVVRPEAALAPGDLVVLVGSVASRPIAQYEPIGWDVVQEPRFDDEGRKRRIA